MQNSPDATAPSGVVQACVVVGDVDTPYWRIGRGEPVVLLIRDARTVAQLFDRLPRRFCTIAPTTVPERSDVDFDSWLAGFLDALGVAGAALVTDTELAGAMRGFVANDPDRVAGVIAFDDSLMIEGIVTQLDGIVGTRRH